MSYTQYMGDSDDVADPRDFEIPEGFAIVGWWCWRGSGHLEAQPEKLSAVPLLAKIPWADGVKANIEAVYGDE
jgi:hypothetical protein